MRGQLNRVQRDKRTALLANVKRPTDKLAAHAKVCLGCQPGPKFARTACEYGWNLAREIRRAEQALYVFTGDREQPEDNGQGTLW